MPDPTENYIDAGYDVGTPLSEGTSIFTASNQNLLYTVRLISTPIQQQSS
jgi:hypothetical protein